jgi:hypothetical protein
VRSSIPRCSKIIPRTLTEIETIVSVCLSTTLQLFCHAGIRTQPTMLVLSSPIFQPLSLKRSLVKPFAKVPALSDLPEIQPAEGSVSNVSSRHGTYGGIDLAEGCKIMRSIKYTHKLILWVDVESNRDPTEIVSCTPGVLLVPAMKSF